MTQDKGKYTKSNIATRKKNIAIAEARGLPDPDKTPGKKAAKDVEEIRTKLKAGKVAPGGAKSKGVKPKTATAADELKIIQKHVDVKIEILAPDHPIIQGLVDKYIEDWKKTHTKDKKSRSYFYFGDAGRCPRELYYAFHYASKKKDLAASTIMMFVMGDLFHDEIQNKFKSMGATANRFIEFGTWEKTNFEKSGRLDLFITENGLIPIMELKSKNPYAFGVDIPDDKEIDQIVSYIDASQKDPWLIDHYPPVPDYGYILYIDRAGIAKPLPIKGWKVWKNRARVEAIKCYFDEVWKAIQIRRTPVRPYARNSLPCTYCRFDYFCWKGVEVEKPEVLKPDPTIEAPDPEILASIRDNYFKIDAQIKDLETQKDTLKKVLIAYFKSKGVTELYHPDGSGAKIQYFSKTGHVFDIFYLYKRMGVKNLLKVVSVAQKKLKEAMAAGIIDGTTFETSRSKTDTSWSIKVYRPKAKKEQKK